MKKSRILIDANPVVRELVSGRVDGIGRTCRELIMNLDAMRKDLPVDISLYTQNIKGVSAKRLDTGFRTVHSYLRNIESHNRLAARLRLREIFGRYDLQHITHNYEIVTNPSKCIVTVHDAFFMKFDVPNFDYSIYRRLYPPFIKACRHIITCSEYSKRDIVETMGINPEKITVIPWAVDHNSLYKENNIEEARQRISQRLGVHKPYFLSVSCDDGRKRTPALIDAYMRLDTPINDLVLIWGNAPENVKNKVKGYNRIHLLSNISQEDLRLLYNCATASVNPTAYEGFGLPVLEAMACGCLVVTCYNSSIPEVGADCVVYLEEPIEKSILQVLKDIEEGLIDLKPYQASGLERSKLFTWKNTANKTLEVYLQSLDTMKRAD